VSSKITWYDPPSGWRYGFPKEYNPLFGETLEQTLLRDGYPQREIDNSGATHVRFWETDDTEFCRHCGAGLGKFRREGEGTCARCEMKG